jgi:hypothetical protein
MKYKHKNTKKNIYIFGFVDFQHYNRYHEEIAKQTKRLLYVGESDFVPIDLKEQVLESQPEGYKNYMSSGKFFLANVHQSWYSLMAFLHHSGYIVLIEKE